MRQEPFTPAWLAGDPRALAVLPRRFDDLAARRRSVRAASARPVSPAVLTSMVCTSEAQAANRERLASGGATCVVTGQQAGLFGGPLYTVYKAASAIVNARALETETGVPCVPLFWLQNEDHDFAEIASCQVLGPDHALHRLEVPDDPSCRGISVSHRAMHAGAALERLATLLPDGPALSLLSRTYGADRSPDVAFRGWLDALFADHGLLVVDPRHSDLQRAAGPVHERAWSHAEAFGASLAAHTEALVGAGFSPQVHIRPGAPLSFVHPEGVAGPRFRVEPEGPGRWRLCGTDRVVVAQEVERGPFSTSALLRPLLQDHLLPTAAYVGGPGEIAYFAQLPPLYEAFDLPMPLVVPRARFRVVDTAWARILDQLGIQADELARGRDSLLRARVPGASIDAMEQALASGLDQLLQRYEPEIVALDPTLAGSVARTRAAVENAVQRLVGKVRGAHARRDTVTAERLDRLFAALLPEGAPQERVHAWPWFGARYGVEGFVDAVLAEVRPFDGTLRDLPLEPSP